jgi:hypothetical protein
MNADNRFLFFICVNLRSSAAIIFFGCCERAVMLTGILQLELPRGKNVGVRLK